jgi:hypothetical protein
MSKTVQLRRRDAIGDSQVKAGHQLVEDMAGRAGVHAVVAVEAEQRSIGARCSGLGLTTPAASLEHLRTGLQLRLAMLHR